MSDDATCRYPEGLHEWAGHRAGGVRRLFHAGSGRPSGTVLQTRLLSQLREWVESWLGADEAVPNLILLIGGPGNGKTEAIEAVVGDLDAKLSADGRLRTHVEALYAGRDGKPVPRRVDIDLDGLAPNARALSVAIVQDASVADPARPQRTAASLLVDDFAAYRERARTHVLLACVNRGVLDDALVAATETGQSEVQDLIEGIMRAVGMGPSRPSCWPLHGYPNVAVWPMDVESLLVEGDRSPASVILAQATDDARWPPAGACPAGDHCPFCTSRELLAREPARASLLSILRYFELATGKRWSFRDLFSLFSYVLAGAPDSVSMTPCEWAATLAMPQREAGTRHDTRQAKVPYLLMAAQFPHSVFGRWPGVAAAWRKDLKDLRLEDNRHLSGLFAFLSSNRSKAVPATLAPQLESLCDALDPAVSDPDGVVQINTRTRITLRELDARFSQSVGEGYRFLSKRAAFTTLEKEVLGGLAESDEELSTPRTRSSRPDAAARLQRIVRDFSCRVARRSIGGKAGIVRDVAVLRRYQSVIEGDELLLHEALRSVDHLLNDHEGFKVSLNTTFGEPLPPLHARAFLTTTKQKVRHYDVQEVGRPPASIRYLSVGSAASAQWIALTYDLFKSLQELQAGMLAASLPPAVTALLDATRARLAGQIVRDEELIDGSEIHIGSHREMIVRELRRFVVRNEVRS